MIAKRFAVDFARAGFEPPYATWPILPAAFDDASKYTARALLRRIEAHVDRCLQRAGHRGARPPGRGAGRPAGVIRRATRPRFRPAWPHWTSCSPGCGRTRWSAPRSSPRPRTRRCRRCSRPASRPGPGKPAGRRPGFVQDPLPGKNPRLHACLRMLLDTRTERPAPLGVPRHRLRTARGPCRPGSGRRSRAPASPRAASATPSAGCSCSGRPRGQAARSPRRRRPSSPPRAAGCCRSTEADLKTFAALGELLGGHHPELNAWLLSRRPAHGTELLGRALGDATGPRASRPPAARSLARRRRPLSADARPAPRPAMPRRPPGRRPARGRPSTWRPSAATWRSSPAPVPARPCCSAG